MGWSDWPYWLKGGIIGELIGILLTFFYFLGSIDWPEILFLIPIDKILFSKRCVESPSAFCDVIGIISFSISALIVSLIIGLIVGFIYGKTKNSISQGIIGLKEWFRLKPYWLKGGIIGVIIATLLLIINYFLVGVLIDNSILSAIFIPGSFIVVYLIFSDVLKDISIMGCDFSFSFARASNYCDSLGFIITSIIIFIVNFIIGAIIGWIYGKIKNKNKVTSNDITGPLSKREQS